MADIKIKCAKCGKEVAVSEFANIDGLRCSCGEALRKQDSLQTETTTKKHGALILKSEEQVASEFASPSDPHEWRFTKQTRKDDSKQKQPGDTHLKLSWLLFIVLGGAMGYVRYAPYNVFPGATVLLKQYGIIVFLALYVLIILRALKDTIFQGLLCLLPLYPFYYIIMICDDFYLRAVVAGAMIGVGWDSLIIINNEAQIWITWVQGWIAHGG
jgi:hypothetical protein